MPHVHWYWSDRRQGDTRIDGKTRGFLWAHRKRSSALPLAGDHLAFHEAGFVERRHEAA